MPVFDFFNDTYSLDEVIDGYTGGSIDNFKGDEDFLNFFISYSLGDMLEGPEENDFKEYAHYHGFMNMVFMDEFNMLGKNIYKIYELCDKDKINFMRTLHHFGRISVPGRFSKELIDLNLSLKEPVSFVDSNIVLSDGVTPICDIEGLPFNIYKNLSGEQADEYYYEVERSFRHRINESIKKNGDNVELVDEMISFVEKERIIQEELDAKRVKDDYVMNINNVYFGKEVLDVSGGVLGMHMDIVSWFEDTGVGILNYRLFRSVPEGDYCMLDSNGSIHIPKEMISKNGVSVGPNTPIRKVEIASVPKIFELGIAKLEQDDPIENEEIILQLNGVSEILQSKQNLSVAQIKEYEPVVRGMYESVFGSLFNNDSYGDSINDAPKK